MQLTSYSLYWTPSGVGAFDIKDEREKTQHYLSASMYTCSLRIVKQQGVNVFNKKNLSSIEEKNIHDVGLGCR